MNRKLLLRITVPSVVFGALLVTACLLSVRYIHQLQANLAKIMARNVIRLQKVQELEIQVRRLRFHAFMYLLNPKIDRLVKMEEDQRQFESALDAAREVSASNGNHDLAQRDLLQEISENYQQYKKEQDNLIAQSHGQPLPEVYKIADRHQQLITDVIEPCQKLLRLNAARMEETRDESLRVSREGYLAMVFLGIAGPIGGLLVGFGVTRGLRRSIYRLSVRVQDLAQQFDQDLGMVSVVADGDLDALEEKMQFIVRKVEEAARRIQVQQRELLRTEQLSQVGQLAAGVAHEIRNPLTGIKLLVEAALRPKAPRPLNLEDTELVLREVKRLETTVQQFLDFARLPAPQIVPCDLREIIRQAWELVRMRATQQHVEPSMHLPEEPVMICADAGQLRTVIVNLFLNALDAIATDGRVEVHLAPSDHGVIRLRICDTGPGIPAEIQEKLFQPFATNKPHGTGLGLFLTSRILDEHGGTISASNQNEGGACFTITLPTHGDGGTRA